MAIVQFRRRFWTRPPKGKLDGARLPNGRTPILSSAIQGRLLSLALSLCQERRSVAHHVYFVGKVYASGN